MNNLLSIIRLRKYKYNIMAAAAEEALKSNYRYNMIFNNTSTNNDDDDVKFNTNLISDFDLQNFDPKRYEYYVNLLKVFNNDPDTLSKLLNKYNSIKTLKGKERKIIREISNYVNKLKDIEGNARAAVQAGGGDNSELTGKKKRAQKLYDSVEKLYNDTEATVAEDATEASDAFKTAINIFQNSVDTFKNGLKIEQVLASYEDNNSIINTFQNSVDTFKTDIENYNNSKQNGGVLLKDILIAKDAKIGAAAETDAAADAAGAAGDIAKITKAALAAAAKKKNNLIKEAKRLAGEATKLIKYTQDANRNMKANIGDKSGISELLKVLEEGKKKDDEEKAKEKKREERDKKREEEEKLLEKERDTLKITKRAAIKTNTDDERVGREGSDRRDWSDGRVARVGRYESDRSDRWIDGLREGRYDIKMPEKGERTAISLELEEAEEFIKEKQQPTRQARRILQPNERITGNNVNKGEFFLSPPMKLPAKLPKKDGDRGILNELDDDTSMMGKLDRVELMQIPFDEAAEEKARKDNEGRLVAEKLEKQKILTNLRRQPQGNDVVMGGLIDNLEEALAIATSEQRTLKAPVARPARITYTPPTAPVPQAPAALTPPMSAAPPAALTPPMSAAAPPQRLQHGGAADEYNDDTLKARYLDVRPQRYNRITLDDPKIEKLRVANKESRESGSEDTGAVKTDNKIEQLSNDIDVYNGLSSVDKDDPIKNNDMIQKIKRFEDDPKNPLEELELTFDDRIVFIIATFFIRYITIIMVQWCIDINIIKTFYEGFIYYAVIYIILFWFIVLFINIDNSFDVKYMNFNGIINSIRTLFYYFYMGTNGISRLLIHTSLILLLIVIPIILNIKKNTDFKPDGSESEGVKILDFEERKQLSKALSLFTMFIWLFTSIIATKF